jgi:hypothetical protein
MVIRAELAFFPSVSPLRAIIKTQTASTQTGNVNAFANWKEVLETETMRWSMIQVSGDRPFIIQ